MPNVKKLKHAASWEEIRSTAADWKKANAGVLMKMLQHMHLIRAFEETLQDLGLEGAVHGPIHSSAGQEGATVASMVPLRPTDQINGSHRAHHQFLAKSLKYVDTNDYDPRLTMASAPIATLLQRAMAEIMGLKQGYGRGRGGSMHLRWAESGVFGTNAIVGGGVPLATGVAWSRMRSGSGDCVVTYLGDGAMNEGAVLESLNLASLWRLPICFCVENNQYAVSTTLEESTHEPRLSARAAGFGMPAYRVDGMDPLAVWLAMERALGIMRAGGGPVMVEAEVYRYLHHSGPLPGSALRYRTKEEEAAWKARDPIERLGAEMIQRGLLTRTAAEGMRQGAVIAVNSAASKLVERKDNKRVVIPSLWPSPDFHDVGIRGDLSEFVGARFEELESFPGTIEQGKFIVAIAEVMARRMETDGRVFTLGEDIHRLKGGTNGATRGLFDKFPDRVLPTPISELSFCGFAGGVAVDGRFRPVVELMYPDFALCAADQIFNQVAKIRHMFGGTAPVPVVIRTKVAMLTGYGSQHSMDPAGLFSSWPGWRIVAPSTPFDYVGLMNSAIACEDPVLVIEHIELYEMPGPTPVDDLDFLIPLGKAKVVREGNAFTVLTYLKMVHDAVAIADELGLDAEVIDLRSLDRAGIDWDVIGASIRKTNNVVVMEQGPLTASYGAMLTDEIQRRFFDDLDQPVKRVHGGHASPTVSKVLEAAALAGPSEIRDRFAEMMADQGKPLAPPVY